MASGPGDPEDLPGLLLVLRELMKGPQRHPNDPVDSSGLRQAVIASVVDVTIDLVSDDDEDKKEEKEDDDRTSSTLAAAPTWTTMISGFV